MDKNVLQSIAGVGIYPVISLVIFGLFFLGLLVYVLLSSRQHLHAMSQMPLLDDEPTLQSNLNHDVLC
ncbi:cbb3-type cytochrome c oxidase subunit 3 [Hymenobacter monticola]|uniref:Cbb3-type cytochrome c oxidase subunit 3 n=1 Tax=Hymenobacter monticola TaxID=1705399 RepID=A0ABY4B973_9BACT|nr:cbb3-type cytochrome c oxidase subunit 3 [Hymenobacter monticola]UOE34541.1 cbb3-type cytochrome c oxidase subunit 3 [Hymenobacter monticola]